MARKYLNFDNVRNQYIVRMGRLHDREFLGRFDTEKKAIMVRNAFLRKIGQKIPD